MIRVNNVNPKAMIKMTSGGDITKDALCVSSSETAVEAGEDVTTQIFVGVAAESCDSGDVVTLYPIQGELIEIDVDTTGTKTTFADADIGTDFDISVSDHDFFIDPDDTTGPLRLVSYDNDRATAVVMIPATFVEIA